MPVRAVLNVVYAMLVDGLGSKQRQQFEASLNGWDEMNQRANRVLQDQRESGGES